MIREELEKQERRRESKCNTFLLDYLDKTSELDECIDVVSLNKLKEKILR